MSKKLNLSKSIEMFSRAVKVIPRGTSSGARLSISVGVYQGMPINYPRFIKWAKGAYIHDVDNNEFIDHHLAFGPIILGHANPEVNKAVREQLETGSMFGMNHEIEVKLCRKIVKWLPSADKVFLTNTGSSATTAAVRIARAYTGKEKVVRFEGHYHGWHDWAQVGTCSGTIGGRHGIGGRAIPIEGVPESVIGDIIVLPWNDAEAAERMLERHSHEIACVICEPYEINNGAIPPKKGYLEALRKITRGEDIVLIFDEVITGFRLGLGGAQELFSVVPDMTTLAKAMANGFPIAAVAGKEEFMEPVSQARVYASGSYNSNPVSTAAALATITQLERKGSYSHLYKVSKEIMNGMSEAIQEVGVEAMVQGPGPVFSIFFTDLDKISSVRDVEGIATHPHIRRSVVFYQEMINRGILLFPYGGGRIYTCVSHSEEDAEKTIRATTEALRKTKEKIPR